MMNSNETRAAPDLRETYGVHTHVHSAVSWPAIIAGAFAASASGVVLLVLGSGLGLAMSSPYDPDALTATKFTAAMACWLIVMQWIPSGIGGYIAGRLRTRWHGLHEHEVFFRDTAHGFVTWAVSTIIVAMTVFSAASGVLSNGTQAAATVAGAGAAGAASRTDRSASSADPLSYYVDSMYRSGKASAMNGRDVHMDTSTVFAKGVSDGGLSATDKAYLTQTVSAQTGLGQQEAATRVDTAMSQALAAKEKAKQAVDTARKSAASLSIFTALAMLIGAFIAAVAAVLGGHRRDIH